MYFAQPSFRVFKWCVTSSFLYKCKIWEELRKKMVGRLFVTHSTLYLKVGQNTDSLAGLHKKLDEEHDKINGTQNEFQAEIEDVPQHNMTNGLEQRVEALENIYGTFCWGALDNYAHSMALTNLNKNEELVTNTTSASKYMPRICINGNPPFQTSLHKIFKNWFFMK